MLHFFRYAAHMQQHAAAAALWHEEPYLHVIFISNKVSCIQVLQLTNYAVIVQQFSATLRFFYLVPGTHLLSTLQNPKRLGLKYEFF